MTYNGQPGQPDGRGQGPGASYYGTQQQNAGHSPGSQSFGSQSFGGQPFGGQPSYGQPAYGSAPQPYGSPAPYAQAPARRSPMLGLISFIVLAVAMIIGTIWTMSTYPELKAWQDAGKPDSMMTGSLMAYSVGALVLWAVGVVTFILGIIATATGRGRLWGILSIVLSVLAPFVTIGIGAALSGGL